MPWMSVLNRVSSLGLRRPPHLTRTHRQIPLLTRQEPPQSLHRCQSCRMTTGCPLSSVNPLKQQKQQKCWNRQNRNCPLSTSVGADKGLLMSVGQPMQLPLGVKLRDEATFDNYYKGPNATV